MDIKKYKEKKIFVTGISGAGKTTFSKKYSKLYNYYYFDFEKNWGGYMSDTQIQYDNIVKKYPDKFITDAIPYTSINSKLRFLDYYKKYENEIKIVVICCTDENKYNERLKRKFFKSKNQAYKEFYGFYFHTLIKNYKNLNTDYYDSSINEYISIDELLCRINWVKNK